MVGVCCDGFDHGIGSIADLYTSIRNHFLSFDAEFVVPRLTDVALDHFFD